MESIEIGPFANRVQNLDQRIEGDIDLNKDIESPLLNVSLGVIVPVFNEANTISELIQKLLSELPGQFSMVSIVVVDDGSTDGTREVLKELSLKYDCIKVLMHDRNQGKGSAIRTGLELIKTDLVIVQDGDLEYEPADISRLAMIIATGRADVVYGSRVLGLNGGKRRHRYNIFSWGVSVLNWLTFLLYGRLLTDEATCYKLFKTQDLKSFHLQCKRFEYCPEVTAKAIKRGLRLIEIPIEYSYRPVSAGKKIRLRDFWEAAYTLVRWRFYK